MNVLGKSDNQERSSLCPKSIFTPQGFSFNLTVFLLSIVLSLALLLFPFSAANSQENKYIVDRIILPDGEVIEAMIMPGPPEPPEGYARATMVALPQANHAAGINILANVPAFNWSFGCTATSAAMLAGYYDRTGYPNMYTGPTNCKRT